MNRIIKLCPNCNNPIDRHIDNAEEKLRMAITFEHGKNIFNAINRHLFRSIDLCNFCYTTLRVYREENSGLLNGVIQVFEAKMTLNKQELSIN